MTSAPAAADSTPRSRSVLVVEDDPDVRELVSGYLAAHGFIVHTAGRGDEARRRLAETVIDVAVLDLGLPDEDGLDLLRDIRAESSTALIVVSARSAPIDRVVGIELGADDYLVKPFELRELLARLRRVLKRVQPSEPEPPAPDRPYHFAGFVLEPAARRLRTAGGSEVALTAGEFSLLLALAERPLQLMSRNALMQRIHGRRAGPFDRAIDVQIGRLRRKLGSRDGEPLIRSVRNGGYMLAVAVTRG